METNVSTNQAVTQPNGAADGVAVDWMQTLFSARLLEQLTLSVIVLAVALVVFLVLNRLFRTLAEQFNLPRLAFTPVRILLRVLILFIAAIVVLKIFEFEVDSIFTVLATVLGLVAIGFVAVWSVLSNFLCTFVLILFKPFSVGDELEFPTDSVSGKVVDLTLLFTTLRGASGEYYQIPNNMFFQKIFKRRSGTETVELEQQLREEKPAA